MKEIDPGAGRALARPLQHGQAALVAGLSTARAGGLGAHELGHGEVKSKVRFPFPHTPDGGYLISKEDALH